MAGQRQDYILRQIELLRQFVARLTTGRGDRELEEALLLSFHLQEKLLPVPPAEFLQLDLAEQVDVLRRGESADAARAKILTYAGLLAETAALYELKHRDDLAAGARQMALYAALCASAEQPADGEARALVARLAEALAPEDLHAPVAELLADFRASG